MVADTVTATPPEVLPWESSKRGPTVAASLHVLADAPSIAFNAYSYPSLIVEQSAEFGSEARGRFDLTLTGTAEERQAVAAALHDVADRIAAWTEADGKPVSS